MTPTPTTTTPACGNCPLWDRPTQTCRAHAPLPFMALVPQRAKTTWPTSYETDWCRQHPEIEAAITARLSTPIQVHIDGNEVAALVAKEIAASMRMPPAPSLEITHGSRGRSPKPPAGGQA